MTTDLIELVIDERLDQSEVLSFTIPALSSKAYLVEPDAEISWRGSRYYLDEIDSERQGTETTITVDANATWYRLGDPTRVGSTVFSSVTPAAGLALLLDGTGWTPGPATTTDTAQFSMEQQDKSVLALLRTWAAITGKFLTFDTATQTVDLSDTRGRDLGLGFRYRRNLRSIRRRVAAPDVTVLYPYGADGLNVAGVNGGLEYIEDFSYYTDRGLSLAEARTRFTKSRVWSQRSFLVDSELLAAAEVELARLAQGVVSYELAVVDLSEFVAAESSPPRVGDVVRVNDPDFGEDLRTTVVRTVRYPNEPYRNRIELAYLLNPTDVPTDSGSRTSSSDEWVQFVGPVSATFKVRNDATWTIARIPLSFREGGRANYHLDFVATGVGGDGILSVEVYDASNAVVVCRPVEVRYVDGEETQVALSWAAINLSGQYDYRVRVTTIADGGPGTDLGVDIEQDTENEAAWWILAQGAVQQTPTVTNSERFEVTQFGTVQKFTVPDNVTEVEVEVAGSCGGPARSSGSPSGVGGPGAIVVGKMPVTPGQIFDVWVGGLTSPASYAFPNGSPGDSDGASKNGGDGGGSSHIVAEGGAFSSALIVAGGGGGKSFQYIGTPVEGPAGQGGLFVGGDGLGNDRGGGGATQFAGGAGGVSSGGNGSPGAFNAGGAPGDTTSAFAGPPAGGGGGWYGGGGGGRSTGNGGGAEGGDGGGGSGWVDPVVFEVSATDGGNTGKGYVEFRWETPD